MKDGNNSNNLNNGKVLKNTTPVRKVIVWVVLAMAFLIPTIMMYEHKETDVATINLVSINQVIYEGGNNENLNLHARAAVLMDADNQRVLYGFNMDEVLPMASTTKIMTCLLALESGQMDEIATVSSYAANQPKVRAGLNSGEQYYIRDLVYSMMLESHNDTAVVIAEHIGGSVEGFAEMMNKKAQELGMYHTYFITPNGLDAVDNNGMHSTTAQELGLLCCYALQNEEFCKIVQTTSYSYQNTEGTHQINAYNKDAFLNQMEGAMGIKTGYTNGAGYCFAGALEQEGHHFVSVVLACGWPPHREYKWQDTAALMNYGINHYYEENLRIPSLQGECAVNNATTDSFCWNCPELQCELFISMNDRVETILLVPQNVAGEIRYDEVIGMRMLLLNGEVVMIKNCLAESETGRINFAFCVHTILERFVIT